VEVIERVANKAIDLYLGKSGSRGQMARVAGKDGVFVVGGYSSYLYTREVKNWRETSILKFEDANVISVEIDNKNAKFSFSKNDDKWSASLTLRDKDGKLNKDPEKKWDKFDPEKVKDLLRAYKSLNAEDFGDDKSDTGFADAVKEGGVVKIKLKDNAGDYTIKFGKTSKGTSRYALKDGALTAQVAFEVQVAQAVTLARKLLTQDQRAALNDLQSVSGRISGTAQATSASGDWNATLEIARSDAQARLAQIPWPVALQSLHVSASPRQITVSRLRGAIGSSTVDDAAARIELATEPRLLGATCGQEDRHSDRDVGNLRHGVVLKSHALSWV